MHHHGFNQSQVLQNALKTIISLYVRDFQVSLSVSTTSRRWSGAVFLPGRSIRLILLLLFVAHQNKTPLVQAKCWLLDNLLHLTRDTRCLSVCPPAPSNVLIGVGT